MLELRILSGPADGRTVVVAGDRLLIGRDPACDLVLDDPEVSRRHAELRELEGGGVELRDLGSANGTLVDGRDLAEPVRLTGRETIAIGGTTLAAKVPEPSKTQIRPPPGAAAPPPPPPPPPGAAAPPPPPGASRVGRALSRGRSSVAQRLKLERSVRRATLLAAGAVLVAGTAVALAVTGVFSSSPATPPTASEIVAAVRPSTVRILAKVDGRTLSSGSGWVYDAERGLVVTNAHVVGDQERPGLLTYEVVVDDEPRAATLYGDAPCYDLAMLKVEDSSGMKTLPLGSQSQLEQGDQALAMGYPGNEITNFAAYPLQSTSGTISVVKESQQARSEAVARDPNTGLYPNLVQTDAGINHGNSGGPLVDIDSQLAGVNTLGTLHTQQQGFAIGVDFVKEQAPILADNRSIGFLGFDFFANGRALLVNNAVKGSEAARVGFGGAPAVVTRVNGARVATRIDYCTAVRGAESGEKATVSGFDSANRFYSVRLPFE